MMWRDNVRDSDVEMPSGAGVRLRDETRGRPFRMGARIACAAVVITGLTVVARDQGRMPTEMRAWEDPPVARVSVRSAAPETIATPLLRLAGEAGELPARAEAPRWSASSGLREDAVSRGSFDTIEAPFLRLTMVETEAPLAGFGSLFVTLARRAAEVEGLAVLRTGLRGQIDTKFGPFEIVETVLSGDGVRACTGFQSRAAQHLQLDGWLCGILGQAPEPQAVVCAIDRLTLAGSAGPILEAAFAESEQRRAADCDGARERSAEVTGSLTMPSAPARPRKNEAQLRRIVQAGR